MMKPANKLMFNMNTDSIDIHDYYLVVHLRECIVGERFTENGA